MQEIAFIAGKGTWEEREMKEGDASVNIWTIKSGRGRDGYYTRYINYKVSETPLIVPICGSVIVTDRTPPWPSPRFCVNKKLRVMRL